MHEQNHVHDMDDHIKQGNFIIGVFLCVSSGVCYKKQGDVYKPTIKIRTKKTEHTYVGTLKEISLDSSTVAFLFQCTTIF